MTIPATSDDEDDTSDFTGFVRVVEPRLRRALVGRYGAEDGRDATAVALAWAFENWEQVRDMANPAGYLYRVGCSRARPRKRRPLFEVAVDGADPHVEPKLAAALSRLTADQRVAVVLTFAFDWTLAEVAELTGASVSTVNTHRRRGLAKLRKVIGVEQ